MSKLYVTEYWGLTLNPPGGLGQAAHEPALVDQTPVDFSGGAAASAAFNSGTRFVRLISDADCCIKFGTAPTATTSNQLLKAGVPEYKGVEPGSALKVSAIASA